jgi:hypothetical protein
MTKRIEMKNTLITLAIATGVAISTMSVYANHHEGAKHDHGKWETKADTNQDGKISFDEYKAARDQHMQERFKRKDTNNDGFIDEAERNAAKEKWRSHHQAMKEKCAQHAK